MIPSFAKLKWRNSQNIFSMDCKLFSILTIFLVEELLFRGPKIIGFVGAVEGKGTKNGLQSILSSSPGIQIRAGRPLADVSENLHWHDEAIPLSVEEDEAVIVDDEVPEFTMGPFLENAFSMDPTNMTDKKTNSSPSNFAQTIQRRLPIHEADLANAILGMPTQKTIININSPGKMLPSANISETNLKQNSTKENSKFGEKIEQEGNKNKTRANKNSTSSVHSILPQANNGNGHCSWQILNIFLLIWSIVSTLHWIWLCSSKLFGFIHFMQINNRKKGGNTGKMLQQKAKMMAPIQPKLNGNQSNGKNAILNKNSELNNGPTSIEGGMPRPIPTKRQSRQQNKNIHPRPHRTIISIPYLNNHNGSISQKMRRMAARKAMEENKLQKSGQMMLNGNGQNLVEIIQLSNREKDESTKIGKHLMYY